MVLIGSGWVDIFGPTSICEKHILLTRHSTNVAVIYVIIFQWHRIYATLHFVLTLFEVISAYIRCRQRVTISSDERKILRMLSLHLSLYSL